MCIPKRYGEGPQERPETIYWHRKYLALTFCVLCLILVLRGYSIPVDSIRGIDLFIPPDSLMGDTISRDTSSSVWKLRLGLFPSVRNSLITRLSLSIDRKLILFQCIYGSKLLHRSSLHFRTM